MRSRTGAGAGWQHEGVRFDPDTTGSGAVVSARLLDYWRATVLSKTGRLTREQTGSTHSPSQQLTLVGLVYHLALVEEDWMEVRCCGLSDSVPWAVDWERDPDWDLRTARNLEAGTCEGATARLCGRSRQVAGAAGLGPVVSWSCHALTANSVVRR